jgi:hypothetical protein
MIVIGIDPGPEESGYVLWDGAHILEFGNTDNHALLEALEDPVRNFQVMPPEHCAIEQIRGFGVMASDKLFDTCAWSGRFLQAFGESRTTWIPRKEAAAHICGQGGISKDKFVREALLARFGGSEKAIGNKKNKGPLHGISGHLWAALAVAITFFDRHAVKVRTF